MSHFQIPLHLGLVFKRVDFRRGVAPGLWCNRGDQWFRLWQGGFLEAGKCSAEKVGLQGSRMGVEAKDREW